MEKINLDRASFLSAAAGFISFMEKQTRTHREQGQLGRDTLDSLKRLSEEPISFVWNKVAVVEITSQLKPRLFCCTNNCNPPTGLV